MLVVPTAPVPSQTFKVALNNQACQINVYQKSTGLFIDLYISNNLVIAGVLCLNSNRIVRSIYLGFDGELLFYDTTGNATDPYYAGLGTTYALLFFTPADLDALYLVDPPAPPAQLNTWPSYIV
jgi:hypothetical protein